MAIFRKKWPGALCFHVIGALWEFSSGFTPIHRIHRNRGKSQQNGPMVPHTGEQDDGSFPQNSLKLENVKFAFLGTYNIQLQRKICRGETDQDLI